MLAAGIASYFFVDRGLFRRLIPIAALAVFFAAAYALIAGIGIQSTAAQISSDSSNEGTLLFRMAMWESLLTESQTVPGVLFGKDLGGGYMQYSVMQHEYIDIPPHNEYLTQFLSVGIAGVVLILAFTIYPLKRFWKLSSTDMEAVEPSASAWVAIIIGIVVYSIPYQPETDAYALLAMANAIVFGLKRGQESPAITAS